MTEPIMPNIATHSYVSEGVTTRYAQKGVAGEVVLLIHGMGCSSLEWSENIDHLSRDMRVVAVDLIGYGESSKPKRFDYSARGQAARLLKLMDHLGFRRFHVVGNSFGGRVAIDIADTAPDRVLSIALVDSAGGGKEVPLPMRLNTLPIVRRLRKSPTFAEFKQGWQFAFHDPAKLTDARLLRKYEESMSADAIRVETSILRSMINVMGFKDSELRGVKAKLQKVKCPALIVWGRQDRLLPVEHAYVLESLLPNSVLKIFDDCGHAPQIERADLFNALTLKFFKGELAA